VLDRRTVDDGITKRQKDELGDSLMTIVAVFGTGSDLPTNLTRGTCAWLVSSFMSWHPQPGNTATSNYTDLKPGTDVYNDAEALYSHWIDSRLWDDVPAYSPGGKLYFHPDAPVTNAQLAEIVYLCSLYFGPSWYDNPADVAKW